MRRGNGIVIVLKTHNELRIETCDHGALCGPFRNVCHVTLLVQEIRGAQSVGTPVHKLSSKATSVS